ncbi:hypothetical protein GGR42_003065 [Saonia flava]|uniref:Uncharacterized protein n=1 Tax=Saonia flava TaxID=523696 RepID=A0A846R5B7_9FLAO|nr:hypothetical protein [Saonia flava]
MLLYTLVTETLGGFIWHFKEFSLYLNDFYYNNNHLIFNIYSLITYLYLYSIFRKFIKYKTYKRYVFYGAIVFLISNIINASYSNFFYDSLILADSIGGVILIVCIGLYFKSRKKEGLTYFDSYDILSWIGLGYATFFIGYLPLTFCRYTIYNFNKMPTEPIFFRPLHFSLIIIMYSLIIIGFIRMKRLIYR